MLDNEFIKQIQPIDFDKYASVSSREKLVAFAIGYLRDQKIQTSFNNVCIATFKLFPEKFYFSEEYPEYPHIEMLNRTLLHLRPKERNYATGSARTDYILTELGEEIVRQVKLDIQFGVKSTVIKKPMDTHKQTQVNEYLKLRSSQGFLLFDSSGEISIDHIWSFYEVTPYTQIDKLKKKLEIIREYCKASNDDKCREYVDKLIKLLK